MNRVEKIFAFLVLVGIVTYVFRNQITRGLIAVGTSIAPTTLNYTNVAAPVYPSPTVLPIQYVLNGQ